MKTDTATPDTLPCTYCTTPMPWGWSMTTVYGSYCRPQCEAQDRARVVVAQVRALANAATIAENCGDKDTYQKIVDLMIKIEDDYYDAGHDMDAYAQAKTRGAK